MSKTPTTVLFATGTNRPYYPVVGIASAIGTNMSGSWYVFEDDNMVGDTSLTDCDNLFRVDYIDFGHYRHGYASTVMITLSATDEFFAITPRMWEGGVVHTAQCIPILRS